MEGLRPENGSVYPHPVAGPAEAHAIGGPDLVAKGCVDSLCFPQ